jgi:metacaspase-1
METIRAVLVGINEYARADIPRLRGCVNDVLIVRDLLRTWFAVENAHIRVVTDERATKAEILRRLRECLEASDPGDLVVFYFSGHGSQLRDRDGDELGDGLDELICPYDMDWDAGTYILDDEFDSIVAVAREDIVVEAFFDCCFWGAVPRALAGPAQPAEPRAIRFAPPPLDIYLRAEGESLEVSPVAAGLRIDKGNVAWAASAEGMPAAEIEVDGEHYGLFTFWGCRAIWSYAESGRIERTTRESLLREVREMLAQLAIDQEPAIWASRELLREPPLTPLRLGGAARPSGSLRTGASEGTTAPPGT